MRSIQHTKKDTLTSTLSAQPFFYVLISGLIYTIRAWEYIAKPQLYAEDGAVWLTDGFNLGIKSLFIPLNGFSHLFERLFGLLIAQLPLLWAPFLFNITAFFIFCLMVYYLYSARTKILTSTFERLFMLVSLCLIANVDELFFNFSNSVFLLGIIGVLLIVAKKSKNKYINVLEKSLFIITCLTLPFAWIYLVILLLDWLVLHKRQLFFLMSAILGSIVQLIIYLGSETTRSPVTLVSMLTKHIVLEIYNQIIIPALLFARIDINTELPISLKRLLFTFILFVCLFVLTIIVFKKSNRQTKLLLLFIAGMTFASLKSPFIVGSSALDAIKYMATSQFGDRYFIFGILGMSIALAKFGSIYLSKRIGHFALVIFTTIGALSSIKHNTFVVNKNFADYTNDYSNGIKQMKNVDLSIQDVIIPVNPGGSWVIRFSKTNPDSQIY